MQEIGGRAVDLMVTSGKSQSERGEGCIDNCTRCTRAFSRSVSVCVMRKHVSQVSTAEGGEGGGG